jgi:hypothetical protein
MSEIAEKKRSKKRERQAVIERAEAVSPGVTLDDERVYPVPYFAETVCGLSTDTFDRICARGEGPPITWFSERRKGIRGKHGKAWLDERARGGA